MNDYVSSCPVLARAQAPGTRLRAWDRAGVWLSGLCAVHCLLVPLVLLVLPLEAALGSFHEALHPFLAVVLLPVTAGALRSKRQDAAAAWLLLLGLALVWAALPAHVLLGAGAETALTLAGSAALLFGHGRRRGCRARSQSSFRHSTRQSTL